MNLAEFRQQVTAAMAAHFEGAKWNIVEHRGVELRCRIEIDETTLIDIYYSTATEKKSYALVQAGIRIFGYDNFRFWHSHPKENPEGRIACQEPSPYQVLREMKETLQTHGTDL